MKHSKYKYRNNQSLIMHNPENYLLLNNNCYKHRKKKNKLHIGYNRMTSLTRQLRMIFHCSGSHTHTNTQMEGYHLPVLQIFDDAFADKMGHVGWDSPCLVAKFRVIEAVYMQ